MKKEKSMNKLIAIFFLTFGLMILALVFPIKSNENSFVPPSFENEAVVGVPVVDDQLGYSELYQEGMAYRVSICGMPMVEEENLILYFTNNVDNTSYLKLRVLNEEGKIIAETGLIKPNEYVKSVKLNQSLSTNNLIQLKIMGYEPDTYNSVGSVVLNVTVNAR